MRKIVFDIETTNTFQEAGSSDPVDLDLAVVCIHDSETDEYSSYTKTELNQLWPILEQADMLIGYNSDHFDIPLLNKYYAGDLMHIKSLDLLTEIRASLGRRVKLDDIAQATLGEKKSADGLQSIVWWREGEYQKVIDYCIQDVKVTKNVYDFARKNGHVKCLISGAVQDIKLKTGNWEDIHNDGLAPTFGF